MRNTLKTPLMPAASFAADPGKKRELDMILGAGWERRKYK
jgi:hypothetical protein